MGNLSNATDIGRVKLNFKLLLIMQSTARMFEILEC